MKYDYTEKEKKKVIETFMLNNKITQVPAKERKKYILLSEFVKRFEFGKEYTEREINESLIEVYPVGEYVEQRRYLITFEFFERTEDGSKYWLS
ncbi:MAG: DUF2087 domain-containing protein [Weeksellaceae bacterium]|uniref:DUF2087 domain-containing protein n=1 Tax=Kaistella sp. TaxID=2782235 RepID=UPI001E0B4B9C|nr:DUF2087 domain-containing protein [Weeksellaceae bacterium]